MSAEDVSITFNASQFQALGEKLSEGAEGQLAASVALANRAIELATRRSLGQLYGANLSKRWNVSSSVNTRDLSKMATVTVETDDQIVRYYEYGTKPHLIVARNAQALRWTDKSSGEVRFAKYVHHPGTKPHDKLPALRDNFDKRVLLEWQPAIESAIDEAFKL